MPDDQPAHAAPQPAEALQPTAAIAAFALPGLGHVVLGEPKRGLLIGVGILGLFFGGIFVGGIDVIDRREDFWWFAGQAGVGPIAFGVDWAHQNLIKVEDPSVPGGRRSAWPDESPRAQKSLGRLNELGALYATLAGLLNVIAVIDAAWHTPRRRRPHGSAR
ncbi:MAG: hypothetical protein IBJ10_07325 [Phycisphaerales bacterium]|nr:hypothetical protein [Phycisphaerales bacterium]